MKCLKFASVLLVLGCVNVCVPQKLAEKFKWKELQYQWPSEQAKEDAIAKGQYIPDNNLPLGLDLWRDRLFITVPRWKAGVASSLNYINVTSIEISPTLVPYPSWASNTIASTGPAGPAQTGGRANAPKAQAAEGPLADQSAVISTFRIRVDECDRLWVMDSGLEDVLGTPKQIAPPALVIFDLNTDKLIRRYAFPDSDSLPGTFFANVVVDTKKDQCENAYAYIPDLGAYGVVVYSFKENRSWRVKHNYFHFDPLNGDYNVAGVNFQWTDGVFGMALGKASKEGTRTVYFHALSSTTEFSVPNFVLQNETRAKSPESYNDYSVVGNRGPNGQATASFFHDRTGILFFTQVNKDAIACWNSNKPFTPENNANIDSDTDRLVFPNDLKIAVDDTLWVLSDRMPLFLYGKLKTDQFNYRILNGKVDDVIVGTPCAP